ncbi:MAG: hypothetical protein ACE5KK_05215 [Candidatus Brocadiales bacterium]
MTAVKRILTVGPFFLVVFTILLAGCAPPIAIQGKVARYSLTDKITVTPMQDLDQAAGAYVVGDVRRVLSGSLSDEDFVGQDSSQILFSLGAATLEKTAGTGELLTLNGISYVKSVDKEKGYTVETTRHGIRTPYSFGIRKGTSADSLQHITTKDGVTIGELYKSFSEVYPGAYAVFGIGHFKELSMVALKSPPIHGEEIMGAEERSKYFHPTKVVRNSEAMFFGIVDGQPSPGSSSEIKDRIFYKHYASVNQTGLRSHSHAAVNAGSPGKFLYQRAADIFKAVTAWTVDDVFNVVDAAKVTDIGHMLEQSVVTDATLMFFKLEKIKDYKETEKVSMSGTSGQHDIDLIAARRSGEG